MDDGKNKRVVYEAERDIMGYIENIRKQIGSQPLIWTGATLLALSPQGQLLMMKRTDNGMWGVPGGGMEPGESLEDTLRRECQEEIGVCPVEFSLFGVYSGPDLYYCYPNGDEVHIVTAVYIQRNFSADIHLDVREHSEYGYFSLNFLPELISPPIWPILADLRKKIAIQ
jgi:8-oxo-dGTP pyrophosphatase MutT (NUDIX family)